MAILTVTSRQSSYGSTNTIIYHHSRVAARLIPTPVHYQLNVRSHGTRVQVQDLFGNMPVRVKLRPATDSARRCREKEWEGLRKNITGLLLAWDSPVCLTIQGFDQGHILRFKPPTLPLVVLESLSKPSNFNGSFNLDFIRSTLRVGASTDLGDWHTWVKTSARTPFLTLRGIISLEPAPSKETQFICLGLRHLKQDKESNILYDHVNALFASSAFGLQERPGGAHEEITGKDELNRPSKKDGLTLKQLKGGGKGVDRWPMFFIRIDFTVKESLQWRSELDLMEQSNRLSSIMKVLEVMIIEYLSENHLRPRIPRTKRPKVSSTNRSRAAAKLSPTPATPFQRRNDMTDLRFVDRSVMRPRALDSVTTSLGDLDGDVKLPQFSRIERNGSRADFSGWSRIKGSLKEELSSTRRDSNMNSSRPVSPQKRNNGPKSCQDEDLQSRCSMVKKRSSPSFRSDTLVLKPRVGTVPAIAVSVTEAIETMPTELANCMHDTYHSESGDLIVSWTNPVSKVNVKIDSRTGSVIEDQHEPRLRGSSTAQAAHISNCVSKSIRKLQPIVTSGTTKPVSAPPTGSWVEAFLKSWDNPIFRRTEEAIPRVAEQLSNICGGQDSLPGSGSCSHGSIERAFMDPSISTVARLTKQNLRNAEIIDQVDNKFILIKVTLGSLAYMGDEKFSYGNSVVVLVDQHAADERIRIEALLADFCVKADPASTMVVSNLGVYSGIETTKLLKPISFSIKSRELSLFEKNAVHFAKWGILYNLNRSSLGSKRAETDHEAMVVVLTLPAAIAERCRVDVKHLIELLRGEVWKREEAGIPGTSRDDLPGMNKSELPNSSPPIEAEAQHSWPQLIHDCPQGILDMLNSRSCRSAIMFNDKLTLEDCATLIQRLAACLFPFQCAHGRPSMIPLVNLDDSEHFARSSLQVGKKERVGRGTADFQEAWMKSMTL